ncbi:hypothetical protein D3C71_1842810 [compost metagenome]
MTAKELENWVELRISTRMPVVLASAPLLDHTGGSPPSEAAGTQSFKVKRPAVSTVKAALEVRLLVSS